MSNRADRPHIIRLATTKEVLERYLFQLIFRTNKEKRVPRSLSHPQEDVKTKEVSKKKARINSNQTQARTRTPKHAHLCLLYLEVLGGGASRSLGHFQVRGDAARQFHQGGQGVQQLHGAAVALEGRQVDPAGDLPSAALEPHAPLATPRVPHQQTAEWQHGRRHGSGVGETQFGHLGCDGNEVVYTHLMRARKSLVRSASSLLDTENENEKEPPKESLGALLSSFTRALSLSLSRIISHRKWQVLQRHVSFNRDGRGLARRAQNRFDRLFRRFYVLDRGTGC